MAAIVLRAFSGMAPSANLKAVDQSIAAYCKNLNLRFTDFRPMPVPASMGAATAGTTLYKFETTGSFITKTGVVNFVPGPIPTDTTERTYYTGDGIPKVTNNTGDVRQLGVPQPTLAPSTYVVVVPDFTPEASAIYKGYRQATFADIVLTNIDITLVGMTDSELSTSFVPGAQPWLYRFVIAGTLASGVFTPTNPAHRALMTDWLGFYLVDVAGTVTGYVDVMVRGSIRSLDTAAITTELAALTDPSDATGVAKMMTADQITLAITALTGALKPANDARDTSIGRIRQLKEEFVALANATSPSAASGSGTMAAFYAKAEIVSAVDDAVDQAVSAIYSAMFTFNN